jgi:RHS repeat-associated protein
MEQIISGDKAKMPMTERFYSVNGQMMGYESGGVKKDFLTDHLGSITAEIDQTQNRTFETRYSAYGRNNWSTGTGCGFGWVGSYGYRETGLFHMSHYVRARHYSYVTGGWSTVDPLWPDESAYGYVGGSPTAFVDPTGQIPVNCLVACGAVMAVAIDFWLVCKDWENEGFSGFFDCTNKVWDELPDWLKQGSQIGLDACLNCLAKGVKCKLGGGRPGGQNVVPGKGGGSGGKGRGGGGRGRGIPPKKDRWTCYSRCGLRGPTSPCGAYITGKGSGHSQAAACNNAKTAAVHNVKPYLRENCEIGHCRCTACYKDR